MPEDGPIAWTAPAGRCRPDRHDGDPLAAEQRQGFLAQSVHAPGTLSAWTGLMVLVGWVVAALAVAAAQLRSRAA